MKWVRCLYAGGEFDNPPVFRITIGKDYKVLFNDGFNQIITIIDDFGMKDYWSMQDTDGEFWFEDITAEVRDNKINAILDEVD